eukprot:XP_013995930.1 PREDICTED: centrosome-associated protein 350-like [Salmo salar]
MDLCNRTGSSREHVLWQRCCQAEKLLEWKRQLDAVEEAVLCLEKEVLAVWIVQASQEEQEHSKASDGNLVQSSPDTEEKEEKVSSDEEKEEEADYEEDFESSGENEIEESNSSSSSRHSSSSGRGSSTSSTGRGSPYPPEQSNSQTKASRTTVAKAIGPDKEVKNTKPHDELDELLDELGDEWFNNDLGHSGAKRKQLCKLQQPHAKAGGNQQPHAKAGGNQQPHAKARGNQQPHAKARGNQQPHAKARGNQQPQAKAGDKEPPKEPAKLKPQKAKIPMVVPHTVPAVTRLVHLATGHIWTQSKLAQGPHILADEDKPGIPLGIYAEGDDLETRSKRSYRMAVFDLSWEILKDIFPEEKVKRLPWEKPEVRHCTYKCKLSFDNMAEVQAFITHEVLKAYGLKKVEVDLTKKFGHTFATSLKWKKLDRVDHILHQELPGEQLQMQNWQHEELAIKMRMVDSLFEYLLEDTVDVLNKIHERKASNI